MATSQTNSTLLRHSPALWALGLCRLTAVLLFNMAIISLWFVACFLVCKLCLFQNSTKSIHKQAFYQSIVGFENMMILVVLENDGLAFGCFDSHKIPLPPPSDDKVIACPFSEYILSP